MESVIVYAVIDLIDLNEEWLTVNNICSRCGYRNYDQCDANFVNWREACVLATITLMESEDEAYDGARLPSKCSFTLDFKAAKFIDDLAVDEEAAVTTIKEGPSQNDIVDFIIELKMDSPVANMASSSVAEAGTLSMDLFLSVMPLATILKDYLKSDLQQRRRKPPMSQCKRHARGMQCRKIRVKKIYLLIHPKKKILNNQIHMLFKGNEVVSSILGEPSTSFEGTRQLSDESLRASNTTVNHQPLNDSEESDVDLRIDSDQQALSLSYVCVQKAFINVLVFTEVIIR
ncbi:hypothetical protein MSG28_008292 [Choristoneura fumiferana]|uniref:Uncharacterized protein n=1 Tax=Choristoneura fumiferana TaxID=7141 RepID=A0ACC0JB36_CHOFU|nr:hypothetical protein MSG28_008292 [Choristoneura fumiferana]